MCIEKTTCLSQINKIVTVAIDLYNENLIGSLQKWVNWSPVAKINRFGSIS